MDTKDRRTGRTTRLMRALPETGAIVLFPNWSELISAQLIFDKIRQERGEPILPDNFSFVVSNDVRVERFGFAGDTRPVYADHSWFEQVPAHLQEMYQKALEPHGGIQRVDEQGNAVAYAGVKDTDAYAKRLKQDTDMSKAACALAQRLIDIIAKYHERNGSKPTHMEVTEEEARILGPHLGGYFHFGTTRMKLDGVNLLVVKRRIGRAAEPVIEWEDA